MNGKFDNQKFYELMLLVLYLDIIEIDILYVSS